MGQRKVCAQARESNRCPKAPGKQALGLDLVPLATDESDGMQFAPTRSVGTRGDSFFVILAQRLPPAPSRYHFVEVRQGVYCLCEAALAISRFSERCLRLALLKERGISKRQFCAAICL